MSIHMPATLDGERLKPQTRSMPTAWLETTLAVVFAVSAVLLISLVAVVTGIV